MQLGQNEVENKEVAGIWRESEERNSKELTEVETRIAVLYDIVLTDHIYLVLVFSRSCRARFFGVLKYIFSYILLIIVL